MTTRVFIAIITMCYLLYPALAFDIQGHRGARGLMPENTLPAFDKALTIGVTTLELDVGVTKDGVVVISHDPALNPDIARDAEGNWVTETILLRNIMFSDVTKYDVGRAKPGSRVAERFASQMPVDGTGMPALSELFRLVKQSGNETVRFNIETKINPLKPDTTAMPGDFAQSLLDVVNKFEMTDRVTVQSFDWRTLKIIQQLDPSIQTVYLSAQQQWMDTIAGSAATASPWTAGQKNTDFDNVPQMVAAAGGAVWSPFYRDVTPGLIAEAKKLGLLVIPWTVNDKDLMHSLIEAGVDGLISDYPDRLREVVLEKKMKVPSPAKSILN